ncbi:MAG TPA: hypothetical protein VM847_00325 [Tahibacter sp.]|nr:hypothetical protein [Tahibacter sp.]
MRRWSALIAVVLGFACGYGYTHYRAAPLPGSTGNTTTVAGDDAERNAARTSAAARAPRRGTDVDAAAHPLRARAAALPSPARPPVAASWSPLLDSLRERAENGDAAAANEWLQRDGRCFAMMPLTPDAGAALPTPGFLRAAFGERSRLASLDPDVLAAATSGDEAERRQKLGAAQQRLLDECRGYVPQAPQLRYALAEIAARLGSDKDFWRFIDEPPFAPGYSRDTEQALDWARRAPALVYERAVGGDAEAAFALGVAYAIDRARELDGDRSHGLLAAAITNDPLQAYRWLSLYLRSQPDPDQANRARALLNRMGTELSEEQRAEAEYWTP